MFIEKIYHFLSEVHISDQRLSNIVFEKNSNSGHVLMLNKCTRFSKSTRDESREEIEIIDA